MRYITVQFILNKPRKVQLVSSKKDGEERLIKVKGLFKDHPNQILTFVLTPKENFKFEIGLKATAKGGICSFFKLI